MSKYQELGYPNRTAYLQSLADDYDLDIDEIHAVAEMLGSGEDFDGLLSAFNVW